MSVFGIFTGMAMPMILFPNVLVNSVSVLLMPAISEAYARKDFHLIRRTIKNGVLLSASWLFLYLRFSSDWEMDWTIRFPEHISRQFHTHIKLDLPFLYLSTTLTSVLHGLGNRGVRSTLI